MQPLSPSIAQCRAAYIEGSSCLPNSQGSFIPRDVHCPEGYCYNHCAVRCADRADHPMFTWAQNCWPCRCTVGQEEIIIQDNRLFLEEEARTRGLFDTQLSPPIHDWCQQCTAVLPSGDIVSRMGGCPQGYCYTCGNFMACVGLHPDCCHHSAHAGAGTIFPEVNTLPLSIRDVDEKPEPIPDHPNNPDLFAQDNEAMYDEGHEVEGHDYDAGNDDHMADDAAEVIQGVTPEPLVHRMVDDSAPVNDEHVAPQLEIEVDHRALDEAYAQASKCAM